MNWGNYLTFEYGRPVPDKNSKDGSVPVYGTNGQIGTSHLPPVCKIPSFIVGRKGAYRGVHYSSVPFSVIDTAFYALPTTDKVDLKWAYYKFLTYDINRMDSGSAIPSTDRYELYKIPVEIPDLDVQNKIVKILDGLDNKIVLNQKLNNNLEQQALALFRHYFMDYVPYGGSIPSDWAEVSLDDVCFRITDGSHYSPADAPNSPYPMYSVKDMETYGFNSSSCKHITEEDFRKMQKNDCVPQLNDILVAKDGSYLKEIFICSAKKDEAILSSIAIFRPNTNIIMPEILLYLLKQPSVRKDVGDNYVSGSALPRIVLKDFKKYRFILPSMNEQVKIGSILHTIRMQTKANIDEIIRLSTLKDTLLPKLMSGELDVSYIDL